MNVSRRHALLALAAVALLATPAACRRNDPGRTADQDLLADDHCRDRGAAKAVREGRHHRGADDLSQRRRDVRRHGGGRGRHHPRSAVAGVGGPQERRDVEDRRQRRDGQFRLAIDGADKIDARRQGSQRQEGRDHGGRIGLRPAGAVDHPGQEDRLHPRAGRRRRSGAQPSRRQCRSRRGLFAAQLPDRQIGRGAHHPRLFEGSAAEPDRGLDRARQIRRRQSRRWSRRRSTRFTARCSSCAPTAT